VIDGNERGLLEEGRGALETALIARVTAGARAALDRHSTLLDARRAAGLVRQCHGDLHLRNLVLIDGRPTLFDAVEFNDAISCIDVLYDLAFLLMDLWRRNLRRHANAVWNSYLFDTGDLEGIRLMPLFLSCRAAIRAKTSATAANIADQPTRRAELIALARDYLELAEQMLKPSPAVLLAIGGFSGSGKSTLAKMLAPTIGPVPGAVVLRSDEIRKQLCGCDPQVRLRADAYSAEMTTRVYDSLDARAGAVLAAGHAAIADAVFARQTDRERVESVARAAAAPFAGVWLDAPADVLSDRLAQRRADASDADAAVLRRQLQQGMGELRWSRIDASQTREGAASAIADVLPRGR